VLLLLHVLDVGALLGCVCFFVVLCACLVHPDVGEVINYEEIVALQGVNLAEHLEDTFGYDLYAYSRDVAVLFFIGFFLRVLALVLMWALDRDKKL